ncbi:MAG TPA: carbohydrate-binding domain-containing protein, partial [Clostridiales bacterium]|nr:carbohydrate-binding domain-containing protein [Clostridiales bacterium]
MKRYKRLLSLACTLVLVLSLMPLQAGAGENYDGVINVVDGTGTGNGWALEGDYIRIKENGAYLISGGGQAASNRICVNSSVTASVTLDNVNININLPFEVGKNSDVTMILKDGSTNILRSSAGHAAIRVFSTAKLTITTAGQSLGNGSLEAYGAGECTSHWASAGIGGSELEASGTIVIDGGNILAVGGSGRGPGTWRGQGGAGIGGAMGRSCGDITINGGNVTAYGGSGDPMGAGIGGGSSDSEKYAGKITINGGTVRAYSGKGKTGDSALGTGIGFCSSVAISDNADVQAYSSGNFPAIYATAVGGGHSAYLLNFMLDARVTSDADMTIKQGDGSVESFNMTLPAIYKNFAATVKSGNDYTAALADGSKKVVSLVGENADFPGILDSLDAIFSSTDVKFVEVDTTPPVLTEGAVYRESAANATVRFFSDEAGTYYYKLMDNETLPDPSNLSDWTSGELTANAINIVTFTGMASGPQYLHILAKDGTGNESDVLTISMPYDLYYSENFETYAEGGYPANFYRKYNGAGDGEQKIIASTQMDGDSGKVFRLKGASSWSSDSRVNLPLGITGTVVYEADIKPVSEVPGSIQMGQGGQWVNCVVRAGLSGGKFYSEKGEYDKPGFLSVKSDAPYSLSNWYSLRLELDYTNKKFD